MARYIIQMFQCSKFLSSFLCFSFKLKLTLLVEIVVYVEEPNVNRIVFKCNFQIKTLRWSDRKVVPSFCCSRELVAYRLPRLRAICFVPPLNQMILQLLRMDALHRCVLIWRLERILDGHCCHCHASKQQLT